MRRLLICLALICGLALAGPGAAIAAGPTAASTAGPSARIASGPSAGDQQYVDPLRGSHTTTHPSSPTPTPAPTAPTSASSSPTVTPVSTTTTTHPSGKATAADPGGLPRTGFDAWEGVLVGIGLLACGAWLRRVAFRFW